MVPGVSVSVQGRGGRHHPVGFLQVPVRPPLPVCSVAHGAVGLEDSLAWRCGRFPDGDSRNSWELGRRLRWRLRGWPCLCWRRYCRCHRPGCDRRVSRGMVCLSPQAARRASAVKITPPSRRRRSRPRFRAGLASSWPLVVGPGLGYSECPVHAFPDLVRYLCATRGGSVR